jgi:alpha-beta hydrolase superfamily lysophospholipase
MNHIRRGDGEPLLLVHGLGGSWRTWTPVLDGLAAEREVIAVDLPGHGETPPLSGEVSVDALADAVASFLSATDLEGVDVVGNSMGGRLVLESHVGATSARPSRSIQAGSGRAGNGTSSTRRLPRRSASFAGSGP